MDALNDFNITHVSAGWNHSGFVIGEHGEQVYGFRSGKHVQLGISNEKVKSINLLQSVYVLNEVNVSSIIANRDHSAALSADGHLYTWGRGFGTPDVGCLNHVIPLFSFTQATLGWNHALVLTEDPNEVRVEKILDLDGIKVVGVASGSEHYVLTTGKRSGLDIYHRQRNGIVKGAPESKMIKECFIRKLRYILIAVSKNILDKELKYTTYVIKDIPTDILLGIIVDI
ncbi:ultraviolet-B receptor UVR8 [Tanacetum coccineum]